LSPDVIAAFLAGVGSILGAGYSLRRAHRQEREDCAKRIQELRETFERGMEKGLGMTKRDA
jgi:RNA-splicing ligase RtcB